MRNRVIGLLMFMVAVLFLSTASFAQLRVSVRIAPPELAVYDQPVSPGDDYIWTPGYWAYGDGDYYWVDGEWVMAPEPGYLWTPGYWGYGDDGYFFNDGYWGEEVGFYGGINYGFGYYGSGFQGGRWDRGHFYNNTSVNHVNAGSMHFTYEARANEGSANRVSFNGGNGGVSARATSQEEAASHARHIAPVASQTQHMQTAHNDPQARFSANHGAPSRTAATSRETAPAARVENPGSTGSNTGAPRTDLAAQPGSRVHPMDLPPVERPTKPNTGNAKTDQKYQKEQEKLVTNQTKERMNLQQKQENEHTQLAKQKAPPERTQQVEQQHEQQTRQLQQTHQQQTQQMQQRQAPPAAGGRGGRGH